MANKASSAWHPTLSFLFNLNTSLHPQQLPASSHMKLFVERVVLSLASMVSHMLFPLPENAFPQLGLLICGPHQSLNFWKAGTVFPHCSACYSVQYICSSEQCYHLKLFLLNNSPTAWEVCCHTPIYQD